MEFIKNGKSKFIIVPVADNPAARHAAEELQQYVKKSSGVTLEIWAQNDITASSAIYIGGKVGVKKGVVQDVTQMDLNLDGYVIGISETDIYIEAQNDRGLIFGVYGFLEKYFHIRFFNTGCEAVPQTSDLDIQPCVFFDKPAFSMRSYLNGALYEYGAKDLDLHTKLRLCNEHIKVPAQYGGRCPMDGRKGTHNMHRYVPKEIYMENHPEFYAINEEVGYMTIDLLNGITADGELDETMDISVAKIVIEELKKDIIANPDLVYFQFEQEDGNTYCEYEPDSEKAKILEKYGRSGVLIRFCNLIARTLQEWSNKELGGRQIYIVTFAYAYTRFPPLKEVNGELVPIDETVVAADNLIIRLAMETNAAYHYFDEKSQEVVKLRDGWTKVCNKFMVWCYDMDDLTHLWYYPTVKNIRHNVVGFQKMGAIYLMFEAGCTSVHGWQYDLRAYLYARLMWNPTQSVNALFHDYMDNYYGVASEQMKKIVAILENYNVYVREIYAGYQISCTKLWSYRHPDVLSDKLQDRLLALYEEGERRVLQSNATDEEKQIYIKRLASVKLTLLHMRIHKLNDEMYKSIALSETTRFRGIADIEPNKPYTIYNVCNPAHKVEVPVDVAKKIKNLNPDDISDEIDFDSI